MARSSIRVSGRWLALGAISLAVLAVTLDVTVLTIGLPTLASALGASESQLQWFVTAYALALAAGMLPAGLLGDRYGRRSVAVAAIIVFGLGSIACAYAPGPEAFIAARITLGLAAAALIVTALSLATVLFDERERPRAIGIWGAANFIGLPLGPILGGWILTNAWWGWIFLINVPIALLALVAVAALVPESRASIRPRVDLLGVALSAIGLVGLMYGIVQAGDQGWTSPAAVGPATAGLAILAAFVLWERRLAASAGGQPLVDLALFRSRSFTWGVILTAFGAIGLFGVLFVLPQYAEAIQGQDPQGAGLRLLPSIAGLVVGAILADRLAVRIGAKLTVAAGFALIVAGLLVGAGTSMGTGDALLAGWTFVAGLGAGLGFATSASAAMVELSADRAGVGSGVLQTIVKLGPAFGASILGSILTSTYRANLPIGALPTQAFEAVQRSVFGGLAVAGHLHAPDLMAAVRGAFVAGMDDALRAAAAAVALAVVLAFAFLPARATAAVAAPDAADATGQIGGGLRTDTGIRHEEVGG